MYFIGNQKIISNLQKSLDRGLLNHAYIFSGPQYVGKFTLAKMFALHAINETVLKLNTDDFSREALLDLIVVEPEIVEKKNISKQRDISVESIRETKKKLSLFPYGGKRKVLIIDDAHKLNTAAQNALLKILEEPNDTTIIILVTCEIDNLLSTLQSRCQILNFSLASNKEMQDVFPIDDVALSAGRPGLAVIVGKNEEEKLFRLESIKDLDKVLVGSLNEKFALAEIFSKDISKTLNKLDIWMWETREKALVGDDFQREKKYADMKKIQKSMDILKHTNANARVVLEMLFMDL
jgi:replication-associated recombination protein RarA